MGLRRKKESKKQESEEKESSSEPESTKPRKSVSIVLEQNKTLEYEQDDTIDQEEIWYIGEDYMEMKQRGKYEAKEWRRQGYGVLLRETFSFPHPDAQKHINAFVLLDEERSRRGLERSLSRQHGEERSEMKDRARQSVLIHQRRLRREGLKYSEMAEKLSSMYQEVTRSASLFARRIAMADEIVVREGEDPSLADQILTASQAAMPRRSMERRGSMGSVMSNVSTHSFDSTRRFGGPSRGGGRRPRRCPSSPASPTEELYAAAIA